MPVNPNSSSVIFISEQVLKDHSVISGNVDMKVLQPTIKLVQDIYLTRLLGTALFADLQDKIKGSSLNDDDKFLLNEYIQPVMIWGIMKEAPIYLTYRSMNKGVQTLNSDNSQPASLQEIQMLVDKNSDRYDWYSQRLINYLKANSSKYTAYNTSASSDDVSPTRRGYNTRLFLGGDDYC